MLWKLNGKKSSTGLSNPFTDVPDNNTFRNAIVCCYHNIILSGTSSTTFSPKQNINRWQIMVMLWRMVGRPTVSGTNPFTDVFTTDSYYKAVLWAYSNKITSVASFRPNDKCSRWQLVVFLYKLNNIYHFI
ncbi:MAG: S-layer homology domain-containing protein [Firmicutes bacterium]|nr:S-layer homology domain-containing protein [Bacillota bacterium]